MCAGGWPYLRRVRIGHLALRSLPSGKPPSLTDQGVSALAAESVYVPRFFSLDFFHRG